MQEKYAENINIDYKLYEYDDEYKNYHKWFKSTYPQITSYNIVNFYKLKILYDLSKKYDEVLYLDFDAIPIRQNNFFDYHDFSKGIHIMTGTAESQPKVDVDIYEVHEQIGRRYRKKNQIHSNRSPTAKYWNLKAMCIYDGILGDVTMYNTGIIGTNKNQLDKLSYFNNFNETILIMDSLIAEESMFPQYIHELFGYDNEVIWGYKTMSNKVKTLKLDPTWHHFMDKWNYIPHDVNIVHCINKNFEYVKEYVKKNNL